MDRPPATIDLHTLETRIPWTNMAAVLTYPSNERPGFGH